MKRIEEHKSWLLACAVGAMTLGVSLAPISSALAQPGRGGPPQGRGPRFEQRLAQMKSRLNLNDQQVAEIKKAFKSSRQRMEQLRAKYDKPLREFHDAKREHSLEHPRSVHEILSCEQREAWRKMTREMHSKRRGHHGRRGHMGPGRRGPRGPRGPGN